MGKRAMFQYGSTNAMTQITGAKPNYPMIRKFNLAAGRMFNEAEENAMRRVADCRLSSRSTISDFKLPKR
jgi:hypothetical protein